LIDSKGDRDKSASDEIEGDKDGKESVCSGVLDIDEKRGKSAKFIGLEPPNGVGLSTEEFVVEGGERNGPVFHNASYDVG